jgi:hypothetical protein
MILGRIQPKTAEIVGGRILFTSAKDDFERFLPFLEEGNILRHTAEVGE